MIFQQTQLSAFSVSRFASPLTTQLRVSKTLCAVLLADIFPHHNVLQTIWMFRLRVNHTEAAELSYDSSDNIVSGVELL